ncbi:tRNA (guanosine(46)-N7)-methyltransferase TrmB [Nesterenkonia sp. F]|uniref:tRNA (guanosine(46)-N7)-methyltransferase TrmB n=1 Tax=Nesterenkonia sp. F TaxID=795955 RepID=UPI000255D338|nr:tRNA (guanosine(46)-N7)-methyltransferase TrmB [Nesterenkonia sp. F]
MPDQSQTSAPQTAGTHRRRPLSFVRRSNRLSPRRQRAWDAALGHELLDLPHGERDTTVAEGITVDWDREFGRSAPMIVEIGSGSGEAVAHAAAEQPETDFLAVEVYRPGVAQLVSRLRREGLTNVRVACLDATEVLDKLLEAGSASEVWIFFPDPWHKKKHTKRRLVQPAFAEAVARVLPDGGVWRMATDWSGYAAQMRDVVADSPSFVNPHEGRLAGEESPLTQVRRLGLEKEEPLDGDEAIDLVGGWAPRFSGRVQTDFESKALEAGRRIFDLTAVRHIS